MKKLIACLNGPNLNFLAKRDKAVYGTKSLEEINELVRPEAKKQGFKLVFFQSNSEGDLINFIQKKAKKLQGILINAGALSHYGFSLHDALIDSNLPVVSVHLSDISKREDFRKKDINEDISLKVISGEKEKSYITGLDILMNHIRRKKFCIFGHPVAHSLSPLIYNSAFIKLRFAHSFEAIDTEDIGKSLDEFKKNGFAGASVTMPHKIEAIKHLDLIDPAALKIGAINTVKNENGKLFGFNTDTHGAMAALKETCGNLFNKKVVLLGAGGAARAISFGLMKEKTRFVILDQHPEKAKLLAKEFGAFSSGALSDFKNFQNFEIIINATSVGMKNHLENESPINTGLIQKSHTVFDIIYDPKDTKLLKDAAEKGAKTISGIRMLLHQADLQFRILTGFNLPFKTVEKIILNRFR